MSLWETNGQEHWKHTFFVKTIVAEQFAEKTTKHVSSFLNKLLFWSWPQENMPKTPAKKCGGSPQKTTNTAKTLFWSCPAPQKMIAEKVPYWKPCIYQFIYFYKYCLYDHMNYILYISIILSGSGQFLSHKCWSFAQLFWNQSQKKILQHKFGK